MNRKTALLAFFAAATAAAGTASATLITYDGLSNASGVLHATSSPGSTNWSQDWDSQGGFDAVDYKYLDTNPLVYPDLVSTPGYASGGNAFQSTGRRIAANFGSDWDNAGRVSSPFTTQKLDLGTVWFSVLLRKETNSGNPQMVILHENNISWFLNGNPRLEIGYISDDFGDGISDVGGNKFFAINFVGIGSNSAVTSVPVTIGDTHLLVVGFDFDANLAKLYINPTSLGGAAPATPDATVSLDDEFGVRSIAWYPGANAGLGSLDELRLGTTFASVTPLIPEPAAIGLLAPAAVLLIRRRK